MKPFGKHDLRLKGWLIQQCPKGRKKFYWFLYWRIGKKLYKEYVPQSDMRFVRLCLKNERRRAVRELQRRSRIAEERKMRQEKEKERLEWLFSLLGMRHSKRMVKAFVEWDE